MLFTTGAFLFLFLPATLLVFFVTARAFGRSAAAAWLALASLFFYGYWLPVYTILLLASVVANYGFGTLILRHQAGRRRAWLIVAVATNLAVLAYFKYANFLLSTANVLVGTRFPLLSIVLPLGISFFTFTQIAYLADVYAGKVRQRNPIHYLLFVTYFPHLIAGPVLHHSEMMPQFALARNYRPKLENFVVGLAFLALGLAKKILIADSVAPVANDAFDNHLSLGIGIGHAWVGVVAYAFQIYFDFSGYSDMAVGLSLLVGVQLPYNFNSPYKARSIIDFWHRWHMTLSRFLRDYLYFALGGNRKGRIRRHVNLLVTMLLGGLWHGAAWTFVIWGGIHGAWLSVERFFHPKGRASVWYSRVLTLAVVGVTWIFFRAKSLGAALEMLHSMGDFHWQHQYGPELLFLAVISGAMILIDYRLETYDEEYVFEKARLAVPVCASIVMTLLMVAFAASETNAFIYFQF